MINATFEKFGWPETRVAETVHWGVMLRREQPTLGALVLACKQSATAFGEVDTAGFAELQSATRSIETMLREAVGYDKINYLMLMMVDPHVHFHVLPRYSGSRRIGGIEIVDAGWPGPPALAAAVTLEPKAEQQLIAHLRRHWPSDG